MIQFPCKCGLVFNLPENQAGGVTQCPRCGLLVDIPQLGELANLRADGTYLLDESPEPTDADHLARLAELQNTFSTRTLDSHGRERDLRVTTAQIEAATRDRGATKPPPPRYDPVTGELLRAIEVQPDDIPEVGPAGEVAPPVSGAPARRKPTPGPAKQPKVRTLSYAVGDTQKQINLPRIFLELYMPASAVVLLFVFLIHVAALKAGFILSVGSRVGAYLAGTSPAVSSAFDLFTQILNIPMWLLLAHYGCVVEDTGPDCRDELPRPLRHLDLGDDIFNPMIRSLQALILCFGPAWVFTLPKMPLGELRPVICGLWIALGCVFLPAVLLTSLTSGSLVNLRPDRVIRVATACGIDYLWAILLTVCGLVLPLILLFPPDMLTIPPAFLNLFVLAQGYLALPLLVVQMTLLHVLCWHLGLLYRAHHAEFGWLFQWHVHEPKLR